MAYRRFRSSEVHGQVHAATAAAAACASAATAALALVCSNTHHSAAGENGVRKSNVGGGGGAAGGGCSSYSDDARPRHGTTRCYRSGRQHSPPMTSSSKGWTPSSAVTTPLQPSTSMSSCHQRVLLRPMTTPERWKVRRSGVEAVGGGGLVYAAGNGSPSGIGCSSAGGSDGDLSPRRLLGRVRTYKDVEWSDGLGRSGTGFFQLVFEAAGGATSGDAERVGHVEDEGTTGRPPSASANVDAHWIQFIRRQKWDSGGALVPNENFPVDRNLWHRRGEWFLDVPRRSAGRTPYYDECALHNRGPDMLSVLDDPRGVFNPEAHSRCVIEFETHLVVGGEVVWRVHWEYMYIATNAAAAGEGREGYVNVKGGPASFILKDFECCEGKWKVGYSHCRMADEDHTLTVDAALPVD